MIEALHSFWRKDLPWLAVATRFESRAAFNCVSLACQFTQAARVWSSGGMRLGDCPVYAGAFRNEVASWDTQNNVRT